MAPKVGKRSKRTVHTSEMIRGIANSKSKRIIGWLTGKAQRRRNLKRNFKNRKMTFISFQWVAGICTPRAFV